VMGRGGAYSTTLFGWARTHMSSYRRVAQHHAGKHAMGRGGGGPIVQRPSDGRGLIRPRFRGEFIAEAIRVRSGRRAILIRVKGSVWRDGLG